MARVEDISRICDVRLLRAGREVVRIRDNCRAIEDYSTAMMHGANGGGTLKGDPTVHVTYQPSAGASVGPNYLPSSNTLFYTVDVG